MEVPPMTRTEAIKEFFKKAVLPVAIAGLLYCIFKSACIRNGELDLLWLWILCGLPFGIHRMCVWIVPGGGSLGGGAALFALNFIIGGVMLSTVGLVCAIVGFVKIKHVIDDVDGRQKVYATTVRQTLIWGLAISAIALIVNIVGIALMMPVLMEAMQTGDFTSILGEGATITAQPSGGSGNAWG